MVSWRPKKKPVPEKRTGLSNDALGWITCGLALIAAIIIDARSEPHNRWHAAIVWTATVFYSLLLWGRLIVWRRKERRLLAFWLFWSASSVLHVFAMWLIFGQLLPRLILGTLYVIPIAFVESLLLLIVYFWLAGKLQSNTCRSDSRRSAPQRE